MTKEKKPVSLAAAGDSASEDYYARVTAQKSLELHELEALVMAQRLALQRSEEALRQLISQEKRSALQDSLCLEARRRAARFKKPIDQESSESPALAVAETVDVIERTGSLEIVAAKYSQVTSTILSGISQIYVAYKVQTIPTSIIFDDSVGEPPPSGSFDLGFIAVAKFISEDSVGEPPPPCCFDLGLSAFAKFFARGRCGPSPQLGALYLKLR